MSMFLYKKENATPPDDFSAEAIKRFSKGGGMAVAVPSEDTVNVLHMQTPWTLEAFKTMCTTVHDQEAYFFFHNHPDTMTLADAQPFILLADGAGDPQLVAFIDGDFSEFKDPKDGHSEYQHFVQAYLQPKINQLYDGDINALVGKDSETEGKLDAIACREIGAMSSNNACCIMLVASNGKVLLINKGLQGKQLDADWGWSSNSLGKGTVEEPKPAPVVVPQQQPTGKRNRLLEAAAGLVGKATAPAPTAPVEDPTKTPIPAADPDKPLTKPSEDEVWVDVPAELRGDVSRDKDKQTKLKRWLKSTVGDGNFPKHWNKGGYTRVQLPKSKISGTLRGIESVGSALKSDTAIPATAGGDAKPKGDPKDFPNANKDKPTLKVAASAANPLRDFGLLTAKNMAEVDAFRKQGPVIKEIGKYTEILKDKKAWDEWEKNLPTFHESTGIRDVTETDRWPPHICIDFCESLPHNGGMLLYEYIRTAVKLRRMQADDKAHIELLEERITELEGKVEGGSRPSNAPPPSAKAVDTVKTSVPEVKKTTGKRWGGISI